MPEVKVYNLQGKEIGTDKVKAEIFEQKTNQSLVKQVIQASLSRKRQVLAKTKDRSEVRGGGRKPWQQKGTGRARQGSIRSPQWKGGGVVFGPKGNQNYRQKINQRDKSIVLQMILSDRLKNKNLLAIDKLDFATGKTKDLVGILKKFPAIKSSVLLVTAEKNDHLVRASNNLAKVSVVTAGNLNALDALQNQFMLIEKPGLEKLTSRFSKK